MTKTLLLPLSLVVGVGALQAGEAKKEQPNIILLMADDLGWGDVGFNGNKKIKTPHMDKMASEGLILDRFYSASAVSSPTRYSVLTGRNPYRSGIFFANKGIMRSEDVTLPELLSSKGYTSGHFGKWHLGTMTDKEKDANRGKVGNSAEFNPPSLHGYNDSFATESKVPTWEPMLKPEGKVSADGWSAIKEGEPSVPYGTAYWDFEGNKVTENLSGDDSRVIMDRVLPFIEKNKKKPFLAVVWFHAPHKPCVAGPEYAAMYKDESEGYQNYAGCITAMDEQIGRLNDYLKANGLDKNTMVWFCSDNGPTGKYGVTGGHFKGKRSMHEGGVRVPAFVKWAGTIKAGETTSTPIYTCDYLPTIVNLAGVDPKLMTNEVDGIDVMDIISGKKDKRNAPFVAGLLKAAIYQDDDYKLYVEGEQRLSYDIVKDRFEKNPIAGDARESKAYDMIISKFADYKNSFLGKEYGTKSFDMLKQKWESPFVVKVKK